MPVLPCSTMRKTITVMIRRLKPNLCDAYRRPPGQKTIQSNVYRAALKKVTYSQHQDRCSRFHIPKQPRPTSPLSQVRGYFARRVSGWRSILVPKNQRIRLIVRLRSNIVRASTMPGFCRCIGRRKWNQWVTPVGMRVEKYLHACSDASGMIYCGKEGMFREMGGWTRWKTRNVAFVRSIGFGCHE